MIDADIVEHLESFRTGWRLSAALRALPIFLHRVPGVSLRFTPGFMLPAAPRAKTGSGAQRTKTGSAAPRTLIVFNGCLSHLLDFIYDSPRA